MRRRASVPPVEPLLRVLAAGDRQRRSSGRLLDRVGLGPSTTPSDVLDVVPGVRLREYPGSADDGPPVLLVPAPIKRSYIWDLHPQVSAVARCREAGLRVFLVEWTDPGPQDQPRGLDDYADHLLRACVQRVGERCGGRPVALVGHSLGGTLAAIFAARRPDLVAAAPHAGWLTPRAGAVPGTVLDLASAAASPRSFQLERFRDLALSLPDRSRLATHLRVQRWTLDEFAMPNRLFEDVVERLYRRDELIGGTLTITGRRVGPAGVRAPLLTVLDPRSDVVPPRSALAFHEDAASVEKQVLEYRGDVGVALQHVGVLVGASAHRELWPEIVRWLARAATSSG